MFDSDKLHRIMTQIEQSVDVNAMTMGGVAVWPYIKASLYSKLFRLLSNASSSPAPASTSSPSPSPSPSSSPKPSTSPASSSPSSQVPSQPLSQLSSQARSKGKPVKTDSQWQLLRRSWHLLKRRHKVMTVCPEEHSTVAIGQLFYNRSTFGLHHFFERCNNVSCLPVEFTPGDVPQRQKAVEALHLGWFFKQASVLCRKGIQYGKYWRVGGEPFAEIEQINAILQANGVGVRLNRFNLKWELRRLFWLRWLFRLLFRWQKTEQLIVICYYHYATMAAVLAANEMGIETIEYQHGIQGRHQPMYNNWLNVPKTGYALVPKTFAMWTPYNVENAAIWINRSNFHQSRLVGNSFCSEFQSMYSSQYSALHDRFASFDKVILVSLQAEYVFPDFLLSVVDHFGDKVAWILKEHPRIPISADNQARCSLERKSNVFWETQSSVYEILTLADLHMTACSTVAFEAMEFRCPTVFFHELALNSFAEQIEANSLFTYFSQHAPYEEKQRVIATMLAGNQHAESEIIAFNGEALLGTC